MEFIIDDKKFNSYNQFLGHLYSKNYEEYKNKELIIKTSVEEFKNEIKEFKKEITSDFIADLEQIIEDLKEYD